MGLQIAAQSSLSVVSPLQPVLAANARSGDPPFLSILVIIDTADAAAGAGWCDDRATVS